MHIEDFITQYTETEIDKINRRDVLTRFQNKAAVQGIAVSQATYEKETSPIRSPQRANDSPGRSRRDKSGTSMSMY